MTDQTAILHRFIDVLNTQRADDLADLLTEDYVQHHTGGPTGRDGVIRYFRAIFDGFPGGRTTRDGKLAEHWGETNILEVVAALRKPEAH